MIKRDIPNKFLQEYASKRKYLDNALEQITEFLNLRLGQCAAKYGVRGRITDKRVKRPTKLWKNAKKTGLDISEILVMSAHRTDRLVTLIRPYSNYRFFFCNSLTINMYSTKRKVRCYTYRGHLEDIGGLLWLIITC